MNACTALHYNNGRKQALCRPRAPMLLVLTVHAHLVTCKPCKTQLRLVHLTRLDPHCQESTTACQRYVPRALRTSSETAVTCYLCQDVIKRTRRTSPARASLFGNQPCYRHYSTYDAFQALCGADECGWARSSSWSLVTCPACLNLQDQYNAAAS